MAHIIQAKNIVKRYAHHTALDKVSLAVPAGSSFGLLGPNGAGKTSLIRILTRITAPDEGELFFHGRAMQPEDIYAMGYLPEERGLYKKMKVGEQLLYFAQLKGLSESEARKRIRLWFEKLDLTDWWNKKVEDLSKGMAQKVQFISTVVHEPKLIILDEPFSGFDPINTQIIKDEILRLKNEGATIIFSTHRMESVEELCTDVALISQSKVVLDGSVGEIKARYRQNKYLVEFSGIMPTFPVEWATTEVEMVDSGFQSVTISNIPNSKELINLLAPNVEIRLFKQLVPSFNDIFIQAVNQAKLSSTI